MDKFYSSFVVIFKTEISALAGFSVLGFLALSVLCLVLFPNSESLMLDIKNASANLSMPTADELQILLKPQTVNEKKIIYISLKDQTLVYIEGSTIIGEFKISSGLAATPTPPGQYSVLKKKPFVNYRGANYNFENTKWNLMFKTGKPGNPLNFYIHGAFWHHNFGQPMSHGCINVSYSDMEGLYSWADEGTEVTIIKDSLDTLGLLNENIYPTPPGKIIAGKITATSASLSWNAASDPAGVAGYQIYQNGFFVAATTEPKYEMVGLSPETLYQFEVYSYNQFNGISFQAEKLNVKTISNSN